MGRLISLSDGIFAFSMTLLVISLALPTIRSAGTGPDLFTYLRQLEPALLSYVVAFLVISTWWLGHHRIFSAIRKYDLLLMRLNTMMLLVISISPFMLAIVFQYGPSSIFVTSLSAKVAVALFAAVEVVTGLILLAIWRHATRDHHLVDPKLSAEWIQYAENLTVRPTVVFAAAIAVALVNPWLAEIGWVAVLFVRRSRGKGPTSPAATPAPR
ncbi:MAG TPA: TMEM175 family protein [Thermoplasmata archaeon]|nr:TMEM175 family protein [Thermoplasmata archaeon]